MLYEVDEALVSRRGLERSIAFQFAIYFHEKAKEIDWLRELNTDLEYNKNGEQPKRTVRKPNGTAPDFILHERRSNERNVLVIEFKGWWNDQSREGDIVKLEDFTRPDGEYAYGLGLLIELERDSYSLQRIQGNQTAD